MSKNLLVEQHLIHRGNMDETDPEGLKEICERCGLSTPDEFTKGVERVPLEHRDEIAKAIRARGRKNDVYEHNGIVNVERGEREPQTLTIVPCKKDGYPNAGKARKA